VRSQWRVLPWGMSNVMLMTYGGGRQHKHGRSVIPEGG